MARNLYQTKNSNVTHACLVPDGTRSGDVIRLGEHLTAWVLTERATPETAGRTAPHNLAAGQATCELVGVSTVVLLPMTGAGPRYAGVNRAAEGTYGIAAGALIGVALADFVDGDTIPVALRSPGRSDPLAM